MSLFELLVSLAIFGILVSVVYASSLIGGKLYLSSEAYVDVQQQARRAFDNMVKELRLGGGTVSFGADQCTFQLALGYNLPPPCLVDAVCWGAKDVNGANQLGWSIQYRLTDDFTLVREILDPDGKPMPGQRVIAIHVNQLSFDYAGDPTRTMTIKLQVRHTSGQLPGGSVSTTPVPLITRVRFRNP